uniref:Uncharacterized protein n=1 Tax=Glossina brevipalpis TaxID=37001 RepID=A0A1A9WFF2_9MUSC
MEVDLSSCSYCCDVVTVMVVVAQFGIIVPTTQSHVSVTPVSNIVVIIVVVVVVVIVIAVTDVLKRKMVKFMKNIATVISPNIRDFLIKRQKNYEGYIEDTERILKLIDHYTRDSFHYSVVKFLVNQAGVNLKESSLSSYAQTVRETVCVD